MWESFLFARFANSKKNGSALRVFVIQDKLEKYTLKYNVQAKRSLIKKVLHLVFKINK